jgi:hypothetical protein
MRTSLVVLRVACTAKHCSIRLVHVFPILGNSDVLETTVADHVTDDIHPGVVAPRSLLVFRARVAHALLLQHLLLVVIFVSHV